MKFLLATGIAGAASLGVAARLLLAEKNLPDSGDVTSGLGLHDEGNAAIMTEERLRTAKVLDLHELSTIWRRPESVPEIRTARFVHPEIEAFHSYFVEPGRCEDRLPVIRRVLTLLDTAGDCPSVARDNNVRGDEPDLRLPDRAARCLQAVPLWKHSITAARHCLLLSRGEHHPGDSLIAALAHDIGKIPVFHQRFRNLGNHSQASVLALREVEGFDALPSKADLERTIRTHHDLQPEHPLAVLLKQADGEARREEFYESEFAAGPGTTG